MGTEKYSEIFSAFFVDMPDCLPILMSVITLGDTFESLHILYMVTPFSSHRSLILLCKLYISKPPYLGNTTNMEDRRLFGLTITDVRSIIKPRHTETHKYSSYCQEKNITRFRNCQLIFRPKIALSFWSTPKYCGFSGRNTQNERGVIYGCLKLPSSVRKSLKN